MSTRGIKRPHSGSSPTTPDKTINIELLRRIEQRMDKMDANMLKLSRQLSPSQENDHGHSDNLKYTFSNDNFSAEGGFAEELDIQIPQKGSTSTDVWDFWTAVGPRAASNQNLSSAPVDNIDVNKDYRSPISQGVSDSWLQIINAGLDGEQLGTLLLKYPAPDNCRIVNTPKVNPVVKPFMNARQLKKDDNIASRQAQVSSSLSAIGTVISELLEKEERSDNKIIIERLNDAGCLLADLHCKYNIRRKDIINFKVNRRGKWEEILIESQTDEWLFGENLEEKLRDIIRNKQRSNNLGPIRKKSQHPNK